MTPRRAASLSVVAGAATWGTTGTSQALADLSASPVVVGAARTVFGAAALGLLAVVTGRRAGPTTGKRVVLPRVPLLVAGVAVAAYQVLFFAGVAATGVAIGTVVGIGSVPVLAGAIGWLVDRQRPLASWWAATALAVVGCALVLGRAGEGSVVDGVGVLLSLAAGLAYAILTVASRRLLDAGVPSTRAMAMVVAVGAVPSAGVLLLGDSAALGTPRGVLLVAWLGIVTVGVGYALYAAGLRVLPPATVGTLTLAEPLVAAVLGVALLGERPGPWAVLGAALLACGLVLVARAPAVAVPEPAGESVS